MDVGIIERSAVGQPTLWGAKDVVLGGIAMLLLVAGAILASTTSQIQFDEIAEALEFEPLVWYATIGATTVALTLVALSMLMALLAWLVLRFGDLPRQFVLPVALAVYIVVAAAPFAITAGVALDLTTFLFASVAIYALPAYVAVLIAARHGLLMRLTTGSWTWLPTKWTDYALAVAIYAVAFLAVTIWALAIEATNAPDWLRVPDNATDVIEEYGLPITAIAVVLLAPFGEEILFRGFAFTGLRHRLGVTGAAVLTSAVFALIHMGPEVGIGILPVTFILGLAFAVIYYKTQSLLLAIGAHALHNAITIFSLALNQPTV